MELMDIRVLMEKFFAEGFTMEGLSRTTGVPVSLLQKVRANEVLTVEENRQLKPVLYFLMQLYMSNTKDGAYLKDMVTAISAYFEVPPSAIANHLGLNKTQFEKFLNKPEQYENGYELTIKLMHLFITFVREKNN